LAEDLNGEVDSEVGSGTLPSVFWRKMNHFGRIIRSAS